MNNRPGNWWQSHACSPVFLTPAKGPPPSPPVPGMVLLGWTEGRGRDRENADVRGAQARLVHSFIH